ncbi:MAG: homoserine kinase [Ignavibacteriales bacterium]|nr:homoserine kinase [Ignavibacteriales bacterium]
MKPRSVKTYAPATISNLGPGFDTLGVAINSPGDTVVARRRSEPGLGFSVATKNAGVPLDAKKNVASFVASLLLNEKHPSFGIEMILHKSMPVGSGLGSSAASSVAAAVAVNALLVKPLSKADLLPFILEGERLACGSAHADNAAPSLLGGGCLIRSYDPLDVVPFPVNPSLVWIVVHPNTEVLTKKARTILPDQIPLRSAIRQWGNVAGLIMGLGAGDRDLIKRCVEDVVAEPLRAQLIPGFYDVKKAALAAGALGCSISGSGPSIFAIASSMQKARIIGTQMAKTFRLVANIESNVYISRTNGIGARIAWRKGA